MRLRRTALLLASMLLLPQAMAGAEAEDRASGKPRVSLVPSRPEQGDALAVFVRFDDPVTRVEGHFIDRDLLFFPWGPGSWMAFAPIPVGARTGSRVLKVAVLGGDGRRHEVQTRVRVMPHEFDETRLRVDPRFIEPPEEERARISREREVIRQAFSRSDSERHWRLPLARPAEGRRTGRFGTRRTFNGEIRSRHMGLDLDGSPGDPICAMADGRVVLTHDLFYAGRSVFIDHGHEMFTVYFHMTDIEVSVGDRVRAGQRIGTIGATGRVTGPHLHLGVRIQGRYVNPEQFLKLDLGKDPAERTQEMVEDGSSG